MLQACGIGGHTGLELEDLQTLVTHTNELADTLRAVRQFAADCMLLRACSACQCAQGFARCT